MAIASHEGTANQQGQTAEFDAMLADRQERRLTRRFSRAWCAFASTDAPANASLFENSAVRSFRDRMFAVDVYDRKQLEPVVRDAGRRVEALAGRPLTGAPVRSAVPREIWSTVGEMFEQNQAPDKPIEFSGAVDCESPNPGLYRAVLAPVASNWGGGKRYVGAFGFKPKHPSRAGGAEGSTGATCATGNTDGRTAMGAQAASEGVAGGTSRDLKPIKFMDKNVDADLGGDQQSEAIRSYPAMKLHPADSCVLQPALEWWEQEIVPNLQGEPARFDPLSLDPRIWPKVALQAIDIQSGRIRMRLAGNSVEMEHDRHLCGLYLDEIYTGDLLSLHAGAFRAASKSEIPMYSESRYGTESRIFSTRRLHLPLGMSIERGAQVLVVNQFDSADRSGNSGSLKLLREPDSANHATAEIRR